MGHFNHTTLPNGLRIVQEPATTPNVYCGLFVDAGTRDEQPADQGLAHFCEHTTFKGTARRRACHIRNRLESVGGDINAFTNKEETVYYAVARSEDLPRALDLLFDIVFHSIYPQAELDKEREVVIDEIDSYNDSPAELIYDEFEEMLFSGHELGRSILGTVESLRRFNTADALLFTRRYYCVSNVTLFVYGNADFHRVVRMAERMTEGLSAAPVDRQLTPLPAYEPKNRVADHGTHQAHVLMGARGCSADDPDRMALYLLNNILGGPGMNSLFNVCLREKRGLVYSVESSSYNYMDSGVWAVYFGCDDSDVGRCSRHVTHVLDGICQSPLTGHQLAAAKKQLSGQLLITRDNFENHALSLGKHFARTGRGHDIARVVDAIQAVTAAQLQDVAQRICNPCRLSTLVYH